MQTEHGTMTGQDEQQAEKERRFQSLTEKGRVATIFYKHGRFHVQAPQGHIVRQGTAIECATWCRRNQHLVKDWVTGEITWPKHWLDNKGEGV